MAKKHVEVDLPVLVKSGTYDTSRTANGTPYFVQDEGGKTVPNPTLIRERKSKADGYFITSPTGNFPNGKIWSINIPAGLSVTSYPESTLFPNPARQNFSSAVTLGRQVRRFFDAAVSLIESGKYQPGPNSTLVPVKPKI